MNVQVEVMQMTWWMVDCKCEATMRKGSLNRGESSTAAQVLQAHIPPPLSGCALDSYGSWNKGFPQFACRVAPLEQDATKCAPPADRWWCAGVDLHLP